METTTQGDTVSRSLTNKVIECDRSRKSLLAVVNTDEIDRYNTVICPDGIDTSNYMKNPVLLWHHGHDPVRGYVPVGKTLGIAKDRVGGVNRLLAKMSFSDDDFGRNLYRLAADGDLTTWSVNIASDKRYSGPPTREEIRARPELSRPGLTMYRRGELIELSATPLPGNTSCMTFDVERSLAAARAKDDISPEVVRAIYAKSWEEVGEATRKQLKEIMGEDYGEPSKEPSEGPSPFNVVDLVPRPLPKSRFYVEPYRRGDRQIRCHVNVKEYPKNMQWYLTWKRKVNKCDGNGAETRGKLLMENKWGYAHATLDMSDWDDAPYVVFLYTHTADYTVLPGGYTSVGANFSR